MGKLLKVSGRALVKQSKTKTSEEPRGPGTETGGQARCRDGSLPWIEPSPFFLLLPHCAPSTFHSVVTELYPLGSSHRLWPEEGGVAKTVIMPVSSSEEGKWELSAKKNSGCSIKDASLKTCLHARKKRFFNDGFSLAWESNCFLCSGPFQWVSHPETRNGFPFPSCSPSHCHLPPPCRFLPNFPWPYLPCINLFSCVSSVKALSRLPKPMLTFGQWAHLRKKTSLF